MQTRPYPSKDGLRLWLSQTEQRQLLAAVDDDPRRRIALQLALHGLRSDEVVEVTSADVRPLANGADGHVLVVRDGKTGKREVPISDDLAQRIEYLASAAQLRQDGSLVDVSTRTIRTWVEDARPALLEADADASALTCHDLRRTWATDAYYSLAFEGVPIAEQLVLSWGGWKQTSTGRETFRQNYLGPVPDHVTERAMAYLTDE